MDIWYYNIWYYIYNRFIDLNITTSNIALVLTITTIFIVVAIFTAEIIINKLLDKPQKNRIYNAVAIIAFIWAYTVIYIAPNYQKYLESKLTTESYTVKKIAYNKESAVTDSNKIIENPSKTIKNVDEPTNNKAKIGKTYYTIKVYNPKKITKLLDTDSAKAKYQNQLIKHTYVQKYYDANDK